MNRGPDAGTLLVRALAEAALRAGCAATVIEMEMQRWASVTFTGARHAITIEGEGCDALETWLQLLPEAEFALRGHLVADLTVEAVRRAGGRVVAEVEMLTVEER